MVGSINGRIDLNLHIKSVNGDWNDCLGGANNGGENVINQCDTDYAEKEEDEGMCFGGK